MYLREAVSVRLRELLDEKGMTQYALFKSSGIAQSTISTILSKRDRTCKLETLAALTWGLEITLAEFFNDEKFSRDNLEFELIK